MKSISTSNILTSSSNQLNELSSPNKQNQNIDDLDELKRIITHVCSYRFKEKLLNDPYIQPNLGLTAKSDKSFNISEKINDFLNESNQCSLLLTAEAGTGKTLFSKRFEAELWKNWNKNKKNKSISQSYIPIYIYLPSTSQYSRETKLLEKHLKKAAGLAPQEIALLQKHCQQGDCHLLILLDGFDEIQTPEKSFYESNNWLENWGSPKVIATSRPEVLSKHKDYPHLFYPNPDSADSFSEFFIQLFNPEQIQEYLNKFADDSGDNSELNYVYKIEPLAVLAKNPLILSMLVKIIPRIGYSLQLNYQNIPPDKEMMEVDKIYLYLFKDSIYLSVKDKENNVRVLDNPLLNENIIENIINVLKDPKQERELGEEDKQALFTALAAIGYPPKIKELGKDLSFIPFTREQIFSEFIDDWIEKQSKRILADPIKSTKIHDQYKVNPKKFEISFKKCIRNYLENLAKLAWMKGGDQYDVLLSEHETLDPDLLSIDQGERFFFQHSTSADEMRYFLELIRSACLLKCTGDSYQFINKSILEYFACQDMFHSSLIAVDYFLKNMDSNELPANFSLNINLLLKEYNTITFLAEKANTAPQFKSLLYKIIELSKEVPDIANAAANAITILKVSGESFSGKEWAGIRIPGADLSGAFCDGADFSGADLTGVNFEKAWLRNAKFENAVLKDVVFFEAPEFIDDSKITALAMDPKGKWLLIGDEKGYLVKWDINTGKILNKCRVFEENETLVKASHALWEEPYRGKSSGTADILITLTAFPLRLFIKNHPGIKNIKISSDGKFAFVQSKNIKVWDLEKGKLSEPNEYYKDIFQKEKIFDEINKNEDRMSKFVTLYDSNWNVTRELSVDDLTDVINITDNEDKCVTTEPDRICCYDLKSEKILFEKTLPEDKHNYSIPPISRPGTKNFYCSLNNELYGFSFQNIQPSNDSCVVPERFTKDLINENFVLQKEYGPIEGNFEKQNRHFFLKQSYGLIDVGFKPIYSNSFFSTNQSKISGYEWVLSTNSKIPSNILQAKQLTDGDKFYRAVSSNQQYLVVGATYSSSIFNKNQSTEMQIIDLTNKKFINKVIHPAPVDSIKFSKNNKWFISASEKIVNVWDLKKAKNINHYELKTNDKIADVAFSPHDSLVLIVSETGMFTVLDLESKRYLYNGKIPWMPESKICNMVLYYKKDDVYLLFKDEEGDVSLFRLKLKDGKLELVLEYEEGQKRFNCDSLKLDNAIGLSRSSESFFKRKGATGQPQHLSGDELKKIEITKKLKTKTDANYIKKLTHSKFVKDLPIDYMAWTVSLVLDPNSGGNSKHAFIVIEGMNFWGKLVLYRFDLSINDEHNQPVKLGFAKVNAIIPQAVLTKHHRDTLNWVLVPHPSENPQRIVENMKGFTWTISRDKALDLIELIDKDKDQLIPFSRMGIESIKGKHNCFTWAKEKLLKLNISDINSKLKDSMWDKLACNPAWHLKNTPCYEYKNMLMSKRI